jgi:hemerythrin
MSVIEWSASYSLGIEQIDQHHQHLISLLNTTYDTFANHEQKVEIEKVIEELVNYATYHFAAEEQLMSQHAYREQKAHLEQHEFFIDQIKTLQQDFISGRKTMSLELIVFLKEWILDHILKCDQAYAEVIKPKLAKERGATLVLV